MFRVLPQRAARVALFGDGARLGAREGALSCAFGAAHRAVFHALDSGPLGLLNYRKPEQGLEP